MEEYQITLKIAAYFLEYPDADWWKDFPEYKKVIDEIKTPQIKNSFADLFDYVEKIGKKIMKICMSVFRFFAKYKFVSHDAQSNRFRKTGE